MDFKGSQFEREIILWGVRWYVAYSISGGVLDVDIRLLKF
jgi:transposase-like protein